MKSGSRTEIVNSILIGAPSVVYSVRVSIGLETVVVQFTEKTAQICDTKILIPHVDYETNIQELYSIIVNTIIVFGDVQCMNMVAEICEH